MATEAAQLIDLAHCRSLLIAVLATIAVVPADAAVLAAEVYRDDFVTVRAGLQGRSRQVVHFGDVLVLIVAVSYDSNSVEIQELDETLFTLAWPVAKGAHLVDWQSRRSVDRESGHESAYATYRFQILGCPNEGAPTCPGDRSYALPEFEIGVEYFDGSGESAHSIRFRPWPQTLRVSTTLQNDDEDQLLPFEAYFPAGGYPEPMFGEESIRKSFVTAGISLALLIGGLFMWPFHSRTQEKTAAEQPRWQQQLQILDESADGDDVRYADSLRRCLVWYCNDELKLDPFVWLDLAESGSQSDEALDDESRHAALRSLFIDLLHNPAGQSGELRQRLQGIVSVETAK